MNSLESSILIRFCGRLFQSMTVLGMKEYLKQSLFVWSSIKDFECDLLVERWTGRSRFRTGIAWNGQVTLNCFMEDSYTSDLSSMSKCSPC